MAQITKKYTMGWYGGCDCKDINVTEIGGTIGQDTFGKITFVATDAQGTSYVARRNSSRVGKLICGTFYIVLNETIPYQEIDIPDFHILSSSGKSLSKCCDIDVEIKIENIEVIESEDDNVILDVSLVNTSLWAYSINGGNKQNVTAKTQIKFSAPVGKHTLTVFAMDENGNYVDEETSFFEVVAPDQPVQPCCSEFLYTHTKSTSEDELGSEYDPLNLQTGKKYGYIELQKAKGPFSAIKPDLDIMTMCHNGASLPDPMPPMDLQSIQNFANDNFFNQDNFAYKHGEIAFGRQYQGKIQVTLRNSECYEGCVCSGKSEVDLVPVGELGDCRCVE